MDLITKGRMIAKVQSKVVELVSVVKLIERLLLFAVNTLNYNNYKTGLPMVCPERKVSSVFYLYPSA